MRVHIVYPRFERFLEAYPELGEIPPVVGLWKYRMPPALGPQILATMMPPEIEWKIVDENVAPIDYDEPVDLVALSYFTPQAGSAYAIGDAYLARGVKVIDLFGLDAGQVRERFPTLYQWLLDRVKRYCVVAQTLALKPSFTGSVS